MPRQMPRHMPRFIYKSKDRCEILMTPQELCCRTQKYVHDRPLCIVYMLAFTYSNIVMDRSCCCEYILWNIFSGMKYLYCNMMIMPICIKQRLILYYKQNENTCRALIDKG